MKKKNQLSTQLVVMDQGYIKAHCLERDFWKKSWKVFEYKKYQIVMRLSSINVKSDTYSLELSCCGSFTDFDMPMNRDDFTDKMFNDKIYTYCSILLRMYVSDAELRQSYSYQQLQELDDTCKDIAQQRGEEYCDQHGIGKNESAYDAVVGQFIDDADTGHATRYINQNYDKNIADTVAALAYWMGKKEDAVYYEGMIDPKWRKRESAKIARFMQRAEAIKAGDLDGEVGE